jgi:hypothetical protein
MKTICAYIFFSFLFLASGCGKTGKSSTFYSLDPASKAKIWLKADEIATGSSLSSMATHCTTIDINGVTYTTATCITDTNDGGFEGTIQLWSSFPLSHSDLSSVTVAQVFDWQHTPGIAAPNASLFSSGDIVVHWESGTSLLVYYGTRVFRVNASIPDGKTSLIYSFTDEGGARVWIDGVEQTVHEEGIYTLVYGTGGFEFGLGGGNDFQGKLYDVVVMNHLSDSEIDGLNCYIFQKHGIRPANSCNR